MAPVREACEIYGLRILNDYLTAARGAAFDSLGPLLALSLVDVAGGMSGPEVFGAVEGLARSMQGCQQHAAVREFLSGAARGFAKSGDHQGLADTLELANLCGAPGGMLGVAN